MCARPTIGCDASQAEKRNAFTLASSPSWVSVGLSASWPVQPWLAEPKSSEQGNQEVPTA
eukprot:1440294-Prymnesium_polylepis.1